MKPSVQNLRRYPTKFPEWQVCPICMGGRGEIVPVIDETTGEIIDYHVYDCSLCEGERVIQRTD